MKKSLLFMLFCNMFAGAIAQCTLTCPPPQTNVPTDSNVCGATIIMAAPGVSGTGCSVPINDFNSTDDASGFYPTGTTVVTWTSVDGGGNTGSCQVNITVNDPNTPTLTCPPNELVSTDPGSCDAFISISAPAAADNCGIDTIYNNYNNTSNGTDTYPLGFTQVMWFAFDEAANGAICFQNITVFDGVGPLLSTQNTTEFLDASGTVNVVPSSVDNGTFDDCGGTVTFSVVPFAFDCSDLGLNTVVFTAQDDQGNTTTANAVITIVDNIPPVAVCQDQTVQLDPSGSANITTTNIDAGSSDNCSFTSLLSTSAFSCSEIGNNTVTLTITDAAGITATCSANVLVQDTTSPTAICQDLTVSLDPSGAANILTSQVDNGSVDECSPSVTTSLSNSTFSCADVGGNAVTLTVQDASGNTAACSASVLVQDLAPPTASANDLTVQLDVLGNGSILASNMNNGSSDNCPGLSFLVNQTLFTSADLGSNLVVFTVTDAQGNTSTVNANVTVVDNIPPVALCQDATVSLDVSGNAILNATQIDNGSSDASGVSFSLSPNTFNCNDLGANPVVLTVTDGAGNTATCSSFSEVQDNIQPAASSQDITVSLDAGGNAVIVAGDVDNGSSDNCPTLSTSVDQTTFNSGDLGSNPVILTVTDGAGNTSTTTANVTIVDVTAPIALCQDVTIQLDGSGTSTINASVLDNGSSDPDGVSFSASEVNFDCNDLGPNVVTLTVTDGSGNTASCGSIVTVEDIISPSNSTTGLTVYLDNLGNAIVTPSQVNNGTTDNCPAGLTFDLSQTVYDVTDLGPNTVVFTSTDGSGNTSTSSISINVLDTIAPVANCQDVTLQLGASGNTTLNSNQVNSGSSDADGVSFILSESDFDCSEIGSNTVVLTVSDPSGNTATCSSEVILEDNVVPVVSGQDITIQLNVSGDAVITPGLVNGGSFDNCGPLTSTVSQDSFDVNDLGNNTIVLTVSDPSGNTSSIPVVVTVVDQSPPQALCQDITVSLNGAGQVTVNPSQVDNGSNDADGVSFALSQQNFNCSDIGDNVVFLLVTDGSGNNSSCNATITVEDNISPLASSQDYTLYLDNLGNGVVNASNINSGSADNCGGVLFSLDQTTFDMNDLGVNPVLLTVTDLQGNTATAPANVIVIDSIAPVVSCKSIHAYLDNTGTVIVDPASLNNGSFDASPLNFTLSQDVFSCNDVGTNPVVLTISDVSGNTATCTPSIIVHDTIYPVVIANDITVSLDVNGNAVITPQEVDNGSVVNCGPPVLALTNTTFDINDLGGNSVVLTVTDATGNSSTTTANITVIDDIDPTALCNDLTVSLGLNGTVSITPAQVDNGSADADLDALSLSETSFDCSDVGANPVVLTVSDASGNTSTCGSIITVVDNMAPDAIAPGVTVALDGTGNGSITATQVGGASTDNCGPLTLEISQSDFTTSDIGSTTIVFTATDAYGNTSTVLVPVNVQDVTSPIAECSDLTVQLDQNGNASVDADMIDDGSSDPDGITFVIDNGTFDCNDIGTNFVVLTVTDGSGNTSTCTGVVTIQDTLPPVISASDVTLQLDNTGNTTLNPSDLNNGTTDNCGPLIETASETTFDVNDLGDNTIIYTVTDGQGNTSTTSVVVTVADDGAPTALCQDLTVTLNANGQVNVPAESIDNGSYDVDSISFSSTQQLFSCTDLGGNTVVLTVQDNSGNTATCASQITVQDITDPQILANSIIVQLDANGDAVITPGDVDGGSTDNCGPPTLTLSQVVFNSSDLGANTITLTANDGNGNVSSEPVTITVVDVFPPTALCQDITVELDASGNATIAASDIDAGSSDPAGVSLSVSTSDFDCDDLGMNTVVLVVTDGPGNASTCSANVMVEDNLDPVASGGPVTVSLDSNGVGVINPSTVGATSTDNCDDLSYTMPQTTFTPADLGTNTIILTVEDASGNTSTTAVQVNVTDNILPVAQCQDIVVFVDGNGFVSITAQQVDAGSSDPDLQGLSVDQSTFGCGEMGSNTVILTATDNSGNTSTCTSNVTVADNMSPVIIANDYTLALDPNGVGVVLPTDVDNGSYDNCGAVDLDLAITNFTAADVGLNPVLFTVTDQFGNASTTTVIINVVDGDPPIAICQDLTVQLDSDGNAVINPDQLDNGSSDPTGVSFDASQLSFTCADLGVVPITLYVSDQGGNISTCTSIVTIEDVVPPIPFIQNLTVQLDGNGNAVVDPQDLDNGSFDQCGTTTIVADPAQFDCNDQGTNLISVTVFDESGNSVATTALVEVEDNVPPTPACSTISVFLDSLNPVVSVNPSQIDAGSYDNCGTTFVNLSQTTFDFTNVGPNNVVLTVTDLNGNTSTCTALVLVEVPEPSAYCVGGTLPAFLNPNGLFFVNPSMVDGGSSAIGGIVSMTVDPSTLDCNDLGLTEVVLTVTDIYGREATCTSTFNVADTVAPLAACKDISVQLDSTGNGSITTSMINNGTEDACGLASVVLSQYNFNFAFAGDNPVILTATDDNGNVSTCSAIVTVLDQDPPTAVCSDFTLELDPSGNGVLLAGDVDGGSTDLAGIGQMNLSQTIFDCGDVGVHTVVLTVIDLQGNSSTCSANVTVIENTAPLALCRDFVLQLDPNCSGTLLSNDIDNGSLFGCSGGSLSVDPANFTCADIGVNTVILTATDNNSNTATCSAMVTIVDPDGPEMVCQDITVSLDGTGQAFINPLDVDNGSSDPDGIVALWVTPNNFNCTDVGVQNALLWGVNFPGDTSACSANVLVQDTLLPTAFCRDVTLELNANGNGVIASADVNNNSIDECGIAQLSLNQTNFTIANVGVNVVVLTVEDMDGNTSTCNSNIHVLDVTPPLAFCQDATIYVDDNCEVTLDPDLVDNGSADVAGLLGVFVVPPQFNCDNLGFNTVTLYAMDVNINSASCTAQVEVLDTISPVLNVNNNVTISLGAFGSVIVNGNDVDNGSSDNDEISSMLVSPATFNCDDIGTNQITVTATDNSGNSSSTTTTINIVDDMDPVAVCGNPTISLEAGCELTLDPLDADGGSYDNCGITSMSVSPQFFTVLDTGWVSVILTLSDAAGNTSTCSGSVNITDLNPPVALCENYSIYIDSSGIAPVLVNSVDNGSNDDCGLSDLEVNPLYLTGQNAGMNQVILTATDNFENTSTCTSIVTVLDTFPPVASCRDITVQVGALGDVVIDGEDLDDGSTDIGGIMDMTAFPNTFFCDDIGTAPVLFTVLDYAGNQDTCTSVVTIVDSVFQVAVCQDITVTLLTNDSVYIGPQDIDNGSQDPCGIIDWTLSDDLFTVNELGDNVVTLTMTDFYGNIGECNSIVTVEHWNTIVAICDDVTLILDPTGQTSVTVGEIDGGSFDPTGIASMYLSQNTFDCQDGGINEVTLTVVNFSGLTNTCTSNVTVLDTVFPIAACTDATIQLDSNGSYILDGTLLDDGSYDLCGIGSFTPVPGVFSCNDVGLNPVLLLVTDINGNSSECMTSVTVTDDLPPIARCADITVNLAANGHLSITSLDVDANSTASCGGLQYQINATDFFCTDLGDNPVILTVTDDNLNTGTCTSTVTVADSIPPLASCKDFEVILSPVTGTVNLDAINLNNGSSDICGIGGFSASPDLFTGPDAGVNAVILTVSDSWGNTSTCVSQVTVTDNVAPVAICAPATVSLEYDGNIVVLGSMVDNGSYDVAGIDTMFVSPDDFDCSDIGMHAVVLTVQDYGGNVSTCMTTVQIVDDLAPTAECQDITTYINNNGLGLVTSGEVNNGSYDACGITYMDVNPDLFGCADIGTSVLVTLSLEDVNGNSSFCTANVLIADSSGPSAICTDITVQLDFDGTYTLQGSEVDGGSSDNCGLSLLTASPGSYGPTDVGVHPVTLEVTDFDGNTSTCSALVTIEPIDFNLSFSVTNEVCLGTNGGAIGLTVNGGLSPYEYNWSNGVTTEDQPSVGPGTYSVTVTDANNFTTTGSVTVNTQGIVTPNPLIEPGSPISACEGEGVTLDAQLGYYSYMWNTGDSGRTLTVVQTGSYWITVTNGLGCEAVSDPVEVTISDPIEPVISFDQGIMSVTPLGESYQWFLNGNAISGATDQTYVPNGTGNYTVSVTDQNGCTGVSDALTGQEAGIQLDDLNIYPNPASSYIKIEGTIEGAEFLNIQLITLSGQIILKSEEYRINGWIDHRVDLMEVAKGVYFLKLHTDRGEVVRKLIVE